MTLSLIAATLIVSNGVNGVMSPDASCVAFQRTEGLYVNLGLYYLSDGRIEWIENGAADRTCGAFPSWTADGSLIYSLGTRSHTAYENWYGGRQEGYVIRIWKDGISRDVLTRARGYDCMPSLAPDGRTVWFCSNRPLLEYGTDKTHKQPGDFIGNRLCRANLDDPNSARQVYEGPPFDKTIGRAFSQPSVSPCGKVLAWAQQDGFTSQAWGIRLARPDNPSDNTLVTPPKMIAYAPRWSPDGTHIAFAGCGVSDTNGWNVYVLNARKQWMRRICPGDNPSFTPDGRGLIYDFGGDLWRRDLADSDFPTAADAILDDGSGYHPWMETIGFDDPESVLLSLEGENLSTNVALDSRFVFGTDTNVFMRVRMTWNGVKEKTQVLTRAEYANSDRILSFYVQVDGTVHFSTREADGTQALVVSAHTIESNRVYTLTGVRSKARLYLAIDDEPPAFTSEYYYTDGFLPMDEPKALTVRSENCGEGTLIQSVEIGTGWPANAPRQKVGYIDGFDWEGAQ